MTDKYIDKQKSGSYVTANNGRSQVIYRFIIQINYKLCMVVSQVKSGVYKTFWT